MVNKSACVFCDRIQTGQFRWSNPLACAFPDAFGISRGHVLVVPREHGSRYSHLKLETQVAMLELARVVITDLESSERPDGFNLGINDGSAAGQTIDHAHLHVIPRYVGDVEDPRGGVRWVIPAKAKYWKS